jgi:uracil DNA glycosylase
MLSSLIEYIKPEYKTSWETNIFNNIPSNIIENTNEKLNSLYNNNNLIIFPSKNKIFNFANYTDFNNIKVVILGYLVL